MLALVLDRLTAQHPLVDSEEFLRHLIALGMREKDAIALVLQRIAASDDIDQQAAVGNAVERGGHARGKRRRLQAGPHGDEETQPLCQWRQRRGNHPGILAGPAGRQ
ncbi:hypothetical protein X741_16585 [Mesorhizobium sp. LNHC229A00]|nr:hypothetical protein X741_16585 [Mesorhizobium sp. LNHC229A00]